MAMGKDIEVRDHITGFKEEIQRAAEQNNDAFFTWFSDIKDTDASFVRGSWDFMVHIASPVSRYVSAPEDKTALEIGYGGGRILSAASISFKKVIGVDIHENADVVEREYKRRGIKNHTLIKTDGSSIPVPDESIDIVYSFIVFQHVEKIEIFKKYISETSRILKPGGIAILYFGRKRFFSGNTTSKLLYWVDRILENVLLSKGFKQIPNKVNCTNLFVTASLAKRISRSHHFEVLKVVASRRKVPDGIKVFGGQHGLVLRKKT